MDKVKTLDMNAFSNNAIEDEMSQPQLLNVEELAVVAGGGDDGGHVEPEKPKTLSFSELTAVCGGVDGGHVEPEKPSN